MSIRFHLASEGQIINRLLWINRLGMYFGYLETVARLAVFHELDCSMF